MSGSCGATVVLLEGLTRRVWKSSWRRMRMLVVNAMLRKCRKVLGRMLAWKVTWRHVTDRSASRSVWGFRFMRVTCSLSVRGAHAELPATHRTRAQLRRRRVARLRFRQKLVSRPGAPLLLPRVILVVRCEVFARMMYSLG